jgi:hypothetical protein
VFFAYTSCVLRGAFTLFLINLFLLIKKKIKASFGSRIRPMEKNSYSYIIAIPLFGCILFKGIVIPIE